MHAWERRLRDLSALLKNCGEAYFSPDLFRRNLNQFLQTSRTVTFIIQKNKGEIRDYENWYSVNVLKPWAADEIMTWAKDARNVVEKEGDLEMHSTLSPSVIYSHVSEEDFVITVDRPMLLRADVSMIAKKVKTLLPPGIADAAVLCIRRRWVANTLPKHELIWALTYIYASLYRVCNDLSRYLGGGLDPSIPNPTHLDPDMNDVSRTRYIKLGKPHVHSMASHVIRRDEAFVPPARLVSLRNELQGQSKPTNIEEAVELIARMAEVNFLEYGNHVPMTFLYNDQWDIIDNLTTSFADQSDKFLYARHVASRASYLRAFAVISVSEAWIRDLKSAPNQPIRNMKIIGERLTVVGAAIDKSSKSIEWNIVRPDDKGVPTLERIEQGTEQQTPFFILPIVEAMQKARHPKS